jgi:hypothetical protein
MKRINLFSRIQNAIEPSLSIAETRYVLKLVDAQRWHKISDMKKSYLPSFVGEAEQKSS